ncbi:MAG: glycosyltransferase family 4 protein [Methyloligellaceae bacterium]
MRAATILQIIPQLDTGGAELATLEIAGALSMAGGRAFVFSEGGRLAPDIAQAGGEVVDFPAGTKNPALMIANGLRMARFIRERGVDLVHARSRAPAWSALLAARRAGVPLVTTYHGIYASRGPLKTLYNSVMARGDRVIANSLYTADLIRERHGTPSERLRVIHRGADLAKFDPAVVSADRVRALRSAWGVAERDRIVLQVARLTDWKGQRFVIEAAARLATSGRLDGVSFVFAGDAQGRGGYAASLESLIRSHGLQDRVRLVGHCDDIPAAFLAAHVAVVASTEPEAFGRAAVEAQAMGCPVVAAELGAVPETVRTAADRPGEGPTGWRVPPADAAALGDAIAEGLALSADARRTMGEAARQHVLDNFSLERMREQTLAVYDELLRSALTRAYREARESGPTQLAQPTPLDL